MVWSICGCVNEECKTKIDIYIRELEDVFPVKDTVYHYYVDNNYCKFKHWSEKLSSNEWKYNPEYVYFIRIYLTKHGGWIGSCADFSPGGYQIS